jgi:hypothetical protein
MPFSTPRSSGHKAKQDKTSATARRLDFDDLQNGDNDQTSTPVKVSPSITSNETGIPYAPIPAAAGATAYSASTGSGGHPVGDDTSDKADTGPHASHACIDNYNNTCYVAAAFRLLSFLPWPQGVQYIAHDHYMLRHVANGKAFTDPAVSNIRTLVILRHANIKPTGSGVAQEDTFAAIANIFAPLLLHPIHTQLACFRQIFEVKCSKCNYAAKDQNRLVPFHIVFPRKGEEIPLSAGDIQIALQNLFSDYHRDRPRRSL